MDAARRVADQIKRNGEFDKCRREVLAKVMESECMKRSIEQCNRLVSDCLRNASPHANIANLRQIVKDEIRKRNLINPVLNRAEKAFHEYEGSSRLHEMIEEVARSELGLPPRDSNIEVVDMEVSSGASSSSSSSASTIAVASTSHSVADGPTTKSVADRVATIKQEIIPNPTHKVPKREALSPSPPPPPPPEMYTPTPSPPPPVATKRPKTPPCEDDVDYELAGKRARVSETVTIKRELSLVDSDNAENDSAKSSPRCAFVSRSPSAISDDSLPPYPNASTSAITTPTVEKLSKAEIDSPKHKMAHVVDVDNVEEISDTDSEPPSPSSLVRGAGENVDENNDETLRQNSDESVGNKSTCDYPIRSIERILSESPTMDNNDANEAEATYKGETAVEGADIKMELHSSDESEQKKTRNTQSESPREKSISPALDEIKREPSVESDGANAIVKRQRKSVRPFTPDEASGRVEVARRKSDASDVSSKSPTPPPPAPQQRALGRKTARSASPAQTRRSSRSKSKSDALAASSSGASKNSTAHASRYSTRRQSAASDASAPTTRTTRRR